MDHSRDPCPWVALSDFGGAFSMGAIGGSCKDIDVSIHYRVLI